MATIKASTTVSEIMKEYPELVDYFDDLGICGCNDGHSSDLLWPIEKIAKEKNMDLLELLNDLNNRID